MSGDSTAIVTPLLEAIGRVETKMDKAFDRVHTRVDGLADGLAGLRSEHDRLAPLHRARRGPVDGASEMTGPKGAALTGRDWSGFARVVGWAAAGIAGTGLGALIMKIIEAPK